MKKTTKRLVSSILATSMLFSSILTSNVLVSAEEVDVDAVVTDVTETPAAVDYSDSVEFYDAEPEFQMETGIMYVKATLEGENGTGVETIDPSLVGSTVNIDFSLLQNPGFSSATFYVRYNPKVLQAKCGNIPKGQSKLGDYITYTAYNEALDMDIKSAFFANAEIDPQIAYVPTPDSKDFADVNPDGTATSAQLGKVKLAGMVPKNYVDENNLLKAVEGDGKLFSMTFDVVGEGNADVSIEIVKFGYPPATPVKEGEEVSEANADPIPSANYPNKIAVGGQETTTEATTEATTKEVTTQAVTKEVTTKEVTTEATTKEATTQKSGEVTTQKQSDDTTETTTVGSNNVYNTTKEQSETTTASSRSGGGSSSSASTGSSGGGGGTVRRSTTKTETETEEDQTEDTTAAVEDVTSVEDETESTTENTVDTEVLFNDLSSTPWAADAINALAELGIINGVDEDAFAPQLSCKRADFAIMLAKLVGLEGTATSNFDDVLEGKYYYNYVGLAKEAGLVNGYGNGKFGPENFCTRAELMVMVANALKVEGVDITADESVLAQFSDEADIPVWARPYIAFLVENGIVNGANGKINPNVEITRAEVAVIMFNVINAISAAAEKAVEEESTDEIEVGTEVPAYEESAYEDAAYTEALNTKSDEELAQDTAEAAEAEAKKAEAETEEAK
ncbi:MAG: S-layer homology domain-containing protein [Firmicutes bacterium]|nr:S-layer homology domain-containing protein [Bacillota bacterium]